MGTSMAPAVSAARSAKAHSGRFSERMAIRSPFAIPSPRRPIESSSTATRSSSELVARHSPPRFTRRWSGFLKVSTDR